MANKNTLEQPEKRGYPSLGEFKNGFEVLDKFAHLFLYSIEMHQADIRDLVIRNFVARAITTLNSIIALYDAEDFQNCWVLNRCLLDRLFHLHHLSKTNSFQAFADYSFVNDVESRNAMRSDPIFKDRLDPDFFRDSPDEQRKYKALKAAGVRWSRPDAERVAKEMGMVFLYKYGFHYASGHVHPMSYDGQDDFFRLTKLERQGPVPDHSAVLSNSFLATTMTIQEGMNCSSRRWYKIAFDFLHAFTNSLEHDLKGYESTFLELCRLYEEKMTLCD